MLFIFNTGEDRPNMLEGAKDENYHIKFARYCATNANNNLHNDYLKKIQLNKNFYKGNQWILHEDTEVFLKDDTNQNRNRITIMKNLIRPMVEQYRGNAIRMQINARVKSVSPQAITRREQVLNKMIMYTRIANQEGNPYGADLKKRLPLGSSESETEQRFNRLYVDKYVEKMNLLLKYVSELNRFTAKQVRVAEELALSGIAVLKNFEYSGNQIFETVRSENFFWDRSCSEYNLTDAEYMGEVSYLTPSEIYEKAPKLTADQRAAIEKYAKQGMKLETGAQDTRMFTSGRVPIYHVYWRDCEQFEYGYVRDQFGYPYLTKINFIEEGQEKPKYTDDDLITVNTQRSRIALRGEKKRKLCVDVIRFASIIPSEVMISTGGVDKKQSDVVLDWGLLPYQETENLDFNNVQFPYKAYCWGYLDGEVLSPIDDAINPQRFINRILSVAENQISNARGSGIAYDKSAVDADGGEQEMLKNMNQSKPVGFNAKGRGIQNIVTQYDSTVSKGTMVMFNIVDVMKSHIQDVTGINEGLKGESTGSDQLVGVTQLMIQRGSLMQEPFYNGISEIFLQCFQSIATVGKRIYADNERELSIVVGDEGAQILKITKDMKLEDFRCFVKRDNTDEILINSGNQMLTFLLQSQIIDREIFADLYNRSTPEDITTAIRRKSVEDKEIAIMQNEQNQQDDAAMEQQALMEQQQQENMMHEQEAKADIMDLQNKKHEMNLVFAKQLGALAKTNPVAQNEILKNAKNLQTNLV